jgi:broad specificity phosphatase PhoE
MDVLFLVRHGETEWNRQRRLQGRMDSALTEDGRAHAKANGALLAREGVGHLLVSPLGRARETAELIQAEVAVSFAYEDRLVERHCGAWEGLTIDEIETRFPDQWAARNLDPFHHRPPGGENLPDMLERIAPLADRIRELPMRSLAIVSHGISGRVLLTHFLGLAPAAANKVRQPNDLVYRLEFTATGVRSAYFRAGVGPTEGLFTVAPELVG